MSDLSTPSLYLGRPRQSREQTLIDIARPSLPLKRSLHGRRPAALGTILAGLVAIGLWAVAGPAAAQNPASPAAPAGATAPAATPAPPAPAPITPPAAAPVAPKAVAPTATDVPAPATPPAATTNAPAAAPAAPLPATASPTEPGTAPQPAPAAAAPAGTAPATTSEAPRPVAQAGRHMPELSAWSMFMDADMLVKGVMLGLAFASVLTWTILLGKSAELMLVQARLKKSMRRLEECRSLAEAQLMMGKQGDVTATLVHQAIQEVRLSSDIQGEAGLKERVASRFAEVQKAEGRVIRRGMGLLATIGSTAPFVGLFGTVWGIMNSFIGIAKSQTTNLAVVAPGIAEALLATAIGLVAAIPAVIVYNHFARATKGYLEGVSRAAGAVGRILSRDLDRAQGAPLSRAHAAE